MTEQEISTQAPNTNVDLNDLDPIQGFDLYVEGMMASSNIVIDFDQMAIVVESALTPELIKKKFDASGTELTIGYRFPDQASHPFLKIALDGAFRPNVLAAGAGKTVVGVKLTAKIKSYNFI